MTTRHRPRSYRSHRSCQAIASSSVNVQRHGGTVSLNYHAHIASSTTRSSATLIYDDGTGHPRRTGNRRHGWQCGKIDSIRTTDKLSRMYINFTTMNKQQSQQTAALCVTRYSADKRLRIVYSQLFTEMFFQLNILKPDRRLRRSELP